MLTLLILEEDAQLIRYTSPTVSTSPPLGAVTVTQRVAARGLAYTNDAGQARAATVIKIDMVNEILRNIVECPPMFQGPQRREAGSRPR